MDLKCPVPNQVWWSTPDTLALSNLRQEKQQSKTILAYKMRLRPAWVVLCQKGEREERGKERERRKGEEKGMKEEIKGKKKVT